MHRVCRARCRDLIRTPRARRLLGRARLGGTDKGLRDGGSQNVDRGGRLVGGCRRCARPSAHCKPAALRRHRPRCQLVSGPAGFEITLRRMERLALLCKTRTKLGNRATEGVAGLGRDWQRSGSAAAIWGKRPTAAEVAAGAAAGVAAGVAAGAGGGIKSGSPAPRFPCSALCVSWAYCCRALPTSRYNNCPGWVCVQNGGM